MNLDLKFKKSSTVIPADFGELIEVEGEGTGGCDCDVELPNWALDVQEDHQTIHFPIPTIFDCDSTLVLSKDSQTVQMGSIGVANNCINNLDVDDVLLDDGDRYAAPTGWVRRKIAEAVGGLGKCVYYVTVAQIGDDYIADKTMSDISEAHNSGKVVICRVVSENIDGLFLPLVSIGDEDGILTAVFSIALENTVLIVSFSDNVVNAVVHEFGGGSGNAGATFTPTVSEDGTLSWTNDKGLPNPAPVNIKGSDADGGLVTLVDRTLENDAGTHEFVEELNVGADEFAKFNEFKLRVFLPSATAQSVSIKGFFSDVEGNTAGNTTNMLFSRTTPEFSGERGVVCVTIEKLSDGCMISRESIHKNENNNAATPAFTTRLFDMAALGDRPSLRVALASSAEFLAGTRFVLEGRK